ncbi:hypothetical protein L0Y46_02915 [bacterium]|nr:hypothetical protein [bacterium]
MIGNFWGCPREQGARGICAFETRSIVWCRILELVRTAFAAAGGEEFHPRKFGKAAEPHR